MNIIASLFIFCNLLLVDSSTKEPLVGVKVQTEKHTYYSDYNGSVDIPKGEKVLSISYISYTNVSKSFTCKSDTVIRLKNH